MRTSSLVPLEGSENTRDLGGIVTADGHRIKYKRLLRSGMLSNLSDKDIDFLRNEYALRYDLDMRASAEKKMQPDREIEGAQYVDLPIFDESVSGITHEKRASVVPAGKDMKSAVPHPDTMKAAYVRMVSEEYSIAQYRRFFEILLSNEEGSVLWHCAMGKDRAGMASVLILSALGVERDAIVEDYLLTNKYCNERIMHIVSMVMKNLGDKIDEQTCIEAFSAREEYLSCALGIIDEKHGGMDAFLENQMGLTPPLREKLKAMYLED